MLPKQLADRFSSLFGERFVNQPDLLKKYSMDLSGIQGDPGGALVAQSPGDVAEAVRLAYENRIPVVGRGAGTSLDGESVPFGGALVVDFSRMKNVLEFDEENMLVTVEPGIINRELNSYLSQRGFFLPPNPGSWEFSTIGGNTATNAGGPRSYKYGSMRRWVKGLEVVTGTGETLWVGHYTSKSSSGLDLVSLLVGSEGTLGLFTKVMLKVQPIPESRVGVIAPLSSVQQATRAVVKIAHKPWLNVSALEFVDQKSVSALNKVYGQTLPEAPAALFLELEGSRRELEPKLEELVATLSEFELVGEPLYEDDVDKMWDLRGRIGIALARLYGINRYREDIAVPVTYFPQLVEGIRKIFEEKGLEYVVFGHAGDGNLHLEFDHTKLSREVFEGILRKIFELTLSLKGTLSGEHGIGYLKRPYLELEHGKAAIQIMRGLKRVFDPNGILNPNKTYS